MIAVPAVIGFTAADQDAARTALTSAALCLVLYLPVLIVVSGVLQTYITGAWTMTYRHLTGRSIGPALRAG